ncbi:MAG TPA: rhodanese-like domain-containing protein [Acidimicrobiales bacterium]|nr:rhodanese-like domain-containing protein [Acidimicrobiales bacterium]
MFFRQYELGCLSLYSYMVGDETTGRAVVVDPQRDVEQYLSDASSNGLRIERVIETHFHADFVSGHLELARATGAVISYGPGAEADFPIEVLAAGQRVALGEVELEIRHTPGHTPESVSVVIWERPGDPWGVLTGDTLFIGDVGRPDLFASAGMSAEELARSLFRSLHSQLLTLPDSTRVFPAHGAGSACGRAMSSAPSSTIGEQRRTNYALRPMSEDDFVAAVTRHQPVAPAYFGFAADTNRHRHDLLPEHVEGVALTVDQVVDHLSAGGAVIDGRSPQAFASGSLRGSINVPLDGRFAEYAGDVVRPGQPIALVTDPGREAEARTRLSRIGFDTVIGHLPDIERALAENPGLAARADRIAALDLAEWATDHDVQLVDVRNPAETEAGSIAGASVVPLARLLEGLSGLDGERPTVVFCASGHRSSVAASTLRAQGFSQVADVLGGFEAWVAAGLPVTAPS